jgi:predicted membrane channel-forming protein YqfA (hemolysin III family)
VIEWLGSATLNKRLCGARTKRRPTKQEEAIAMPASEVSTITALGVGIATVYGLYLFPPIKDKTFRSLNFWLSVGLLFLSIFLVAHLVSGNPSTSIVNALIFTTNGLVLGCANYYWQRRKRDKSGTKGS